MFEKQVDLSKRKKKVFSLESNVFSESLLEAMIFVRKQKLSSRERLISGFISPLKS